MTTIILSIAGIILIPLLAYLEVEREERISRHLTTPHSDRHHLPVKSRFRKERQKK
jgi:hypothetical protein